MASLELDKRVSFSRLGVDDRSRFNYLGDLVRRFKRIDTVPGLISEILLHDGPPTFRSEGYLNEKKNKHAKLEKILASFLTLNGVTYDQNEVLWAIADADISLELIKLSLKSKEAQEFGLKVVELGTGGGLVPLLAALDEEIANLEWHIVEGLVEHY